MIHLVLFFECLPRDYSVGPRSGLVIKQKNTKAIIRLFRGPSLLKKLVEVIICTLFVNKAKIHAVTTRRLTGTKHPRDPTSGKSNFKGDGKIQIR